MVTTIMQKKELNELWREYDFGDRVYRIEHPKLLFMRLPDGTTHRIVDSKGIVHYNNLFLYPSDQG